MLCTVVYIFSTCLFIVNGDLSYPIFRSASEPEKNKSDNDMRRIPSQYAEAETDSEDQETSEEALKIPINPEPEVGSEPEGSDVDERETSINKKRTGKIRNKLRERNISLDAGFRVEFSLNRTWSSPGTSTDKTTTTTTSREIGLIGRTQPGDTTYYVYHGTFSSSVSPLRITTKAVARVRPHKIINDKKLKKFPERVYKNALKAFEKIKCDFDEYTREKIDMVVEAYKLKFTEFMKCTSKASIKTKHGIQNAVLHTLETSKLIMRRVVNFLNTCIEEIYTSALINGGVVRLQQKVEAHVSKEYDYACKAFGVCSSRCSFRLELQNILSTLLIMEDFKLIQANDAATEVLKQNDITIFINSYALELKIYKAIRHQEITDADEIRSDLSVLYNAISKSHLPLVLDEGRSATMAVKRTIKLRCLLDSLDEALPASQNQKAWSNIRNKLQRFQDGGPREIQESLQALFDNVKEAMKIYDGAESIRDTLKELVREALN